MELDHFIWYPIPGKGYQDKPIALSGTFNTFIYIKLFKNEYVPIIVQYSKKKFVGYMFFNKPNLDYVLFSRIFHKENLDEYGRTGVIHHSAIIERRHLENGRISLLSVEKAMSEFTDSHPFPKGNIEPLIVEENKTRNFGYAGEIKKYLTPQSVEMLATRITESPANKTSLRCLGANKDIRLKIGVYLVELLNFTCHLRPISFTTERPSQNEYYNLFDVVIWERALMPTANAENWAVILWDAIEYNLPHIKGKENIYRKIHEAFTD